MDCMDSEKLIEKKLKKEVEKLGGLALKFQSSFYTGFPDRIVLTAKTKIYFVELKSEGKKPTLKQLYVHKVLRGLGFEVFVIDTLDLLEKFITYIK